MATVNMYKVAPLVKDVKGKINPANIMYHVDRIFKGSLSADTVKSTGDIVQNLTDLENKIVGRLGKYSIKNSFFRPPIFQKF